MNSRECFKDFPEAAMVSPKRIATDVPGAVDYSGQSRAQLYKDMRSGRLVAFKNGRRTFIFLDDLEGYLRALPRATFVPSPSDEATQKLNNVST